MNLQWYPGHMAKAKREIRERLGLVDVVVELIDARAPRSSVNEDLIEVLDGKPCIIAMNKSDLADSARTNEWVSYYDDIGVVATPIFCADFEGDNGFSALKKEIRKAVESRKTRDAQRGIVGRAVKILVVGIPNVGKSAFINRFSGRGVMKTGDRPGVTLAQQWMKVSEQNGDWYDILDTPGILPPKFETEEEGLALAWIGSIKDEIYDIVEAAMHLCAFMAYNYEDNLRDRYKLTDCLGDGYDILLEIGRKRGCVIRGGEIDEQRVAGIILDEFRAGKMGRVTVEHA